MKVVLNEKNFLMKNGFDELVLHLRGLTCTLPWQQYEERIKSLSQESKVSRFCMEARFMHVVEVGQYFMTKDTGDF